MKKAFRTILLAASLALSMSAHAYDADVRHSTVELKEITGEETWNGLWQKYFSNNEVNAKNRYEQSERLYRITVVSENGFVFFTKDTHPAHPSFAKVFLVKGDGNSAKLRIFGFTWGDRGSYDTFMREEILPFGNHLATQMRNRAPQ